MDLDKRIETVKQNSGSSIKKYGKWILIGIVALWGVFSYNGLIDAEEPVKKAEGNIEAEYQSRADKVKVISKIVKSAANFEYTTLVDVVKARQMKDDLKKAGEKIDNTTKKLEDFNGEKDVNNPAYRNLQNQLTGSLGGINVVFERYPELKATEAYRDFQAQYEGIENRIAKVGKVSFIYAKLKKHLRLNLRCFKCDFKKVLLFNYFERFFSSINSNSSNIDTRL